MRETLLAQARYRSDQILLQPVKSIDLTLEQEFKKGEAASLLLAVQLPQTLLDEAETVLEQFKKHEDEADAGPEHDDHERSAP